MAYETKQTSTKAPGKKKDAEKLANLLRDFKIAYEYKKKWLDYSQEDVEFALGKQWDDEDVEALKDAKVRALTINKIRPIIFLLTGMESQNRSDFLAFPEGEEDGVIAEIVTNLIKNVMKRSDGQYKVSELFENGLQAGECFIEPYLDYTDDMLYGKLKWKIADGRSIFPDPNRKEYDLSDAGYVCKLTQDLTMDQLKSLFPKKIKELEKLDPNLGKLNLDKIGMPMDSQGTAIQRKGYSDAKDEETTGEATRPVYDLLEYQYKKYVPRYYVADVDLGTIIEVKSKADADNYVKVVQENHQKALLEYQAALASGGQNVQPPQEPRVEAIERMVPEIWVCSVIGGHDDIFDEQRLWCYPRWKSWSIIPLYIYWSTAEVKKENRHLLVQGIVRGLKDPQREMNKRKTQELRILNTSANSGFIAVKDSWVDRQKVEDFGSSPGVNLEWDWDKAHGVPPQKITPTPLSQGHAQLAAENAQDLKEISGINTDLLAMQEGGTDSGRAIALRQRQGMVMVQKIFDNLSRTKRLMGRFILSQLGEIYDAKTAIKVLGETFLQQSFQKPAVMNTAMGPQQVMDPATGGPVMEFDPQAAALTVDKVLKDAQLGEYDVQIGEGASSETVKFANYQVLTDLAKSGIPIPPDIIIEESLLSTGSKEKIKSAIERAQMAASKAPAKPAPKGE